MWANIEAAELHLKADQALEIHDGVGASVAVRSGRIWITQRGDRRDIVLEAGESFRIDRAGLTLVSALREATIAVGAARSHAPVPARRIGFGLRGRLAAA